MTLGWIPMSSNSRQCDTTEQLKQWLSIWLRVILWVSFCLVSFCWVILLGHSAECHSAECHSDECHSAECHSAECHSVGSFCWVSFCWVSFCWKSCCPRTNAIKCDWMLQQIKNWKKCVYSSVSIICCNTQQNCPCFNHRYLNTYLDGEL